MIAIPFMISLENWPSIAKRASWSRLVRPAPNDSVFRVVEPPKIGATIQGLLAFFSLPKGF
jgi:hypothetical protein